MLRAALGPPGPAGAIHTWNGGQGAAIVHRNWGDVLAECPFCGSEVTDDLVSFGGTCPKCFAEIPGEEAATDPGVDVRNAQERRDRRRASFRTMASLAVLLVIVSCTGIAAFVTVLWPEPDVAEILDFDTLDFPMPVELLGVEEAPVEPGPRPARPTRPTPVEPATDAVTSTDGVRRPRTEIGPLVPTKAVPGVKPGSKPGTVDLSMDAPTVRRDDNLVLSDPEAIRDMIGERLVEFIPGLKVCYDRRLKAVPTLQGRWRLRFTIATSGRVFASDATGLDKRDAELEKCLSEHMTEQWRFGRISVSQPVQRTLRFQP